MVNGNQLVDTGKLFFSAKNLVHGFVDIQAPKNVERRFTSIVY